jgi:GAF domain
VPGTRLRRILGALEETTGDDLSAARLCKVTTQMVGVTGAGIMLMSGEVPQGSLCTTNDVSDRIEELQYTLGEGPCVDAYHHNRVVLEPDLANPTRPRWLAFTPRALEVGVRAMFAFPVRDGAARLGALNLYQDRPGPLGDDGHADALVMAEVIAHWVLDAQGAAPSGAVAKELESGADFHFVVQNAAGMVSVQLGVSVTEALIRLRAYAFSENRLVREVAEDVVAHRLRLL